MSGTRRRVVLKPGEEKRLLAGEFWAYDNEIRGSIRHFAAGEVVELRSADDRFVATGYINPASTIAFRALTFDPGQAVDATLLAERVGRADRQRLALAPGNYYRMVYGEADFLPGLVVDRFDDYFIVQITTAGMERFKDELFAIVNRLYPQGVVVEKSLSASREKEGLAAINRVVTPGRTAEKEIEINGLRFRVDFLKSQKTGFFLDQRENYLLLRHIAAGRDVLDAFSYAGAWGLHAHAFGAKRVEFLEISAEYLEQTRENIRLNGFPEGAFAFTRDDAVGRLKEMSKAGMRKDLIILDPPAFVKSRAKLKEAMRGYKEINLRALKMLAPDGFLVTCSCSHFLGRDDFLATVQAAAADANRRIKLLEFRTQPPDHGVLLPLHQSAYLKCALFAVY